MLRVEARLEVGPGKGTRTTFLGDPDSPFFILGRLRGGEVGVDKFLYEQRVSGNSYRLVYIKSYLA